MYYKVIISLLCCMVISLSCIAKPLEGIVTNDPETCPARLKGGAGKNDPRGTIHKGQVQFDHSRGLIGCKIDQMTGRIDFIYPDSNLLKAGVTTGSFILEIEHERRRPCLLPNVVIYPKGYILNLLIRTPEGVTKSVNVQLVDYKKYLSTDI